MLVRLNDHLLVLGAAGVLTIPAPSPIESFVFSTYAPTMEMLVSRLPTFGSSAPDTSYNAGITTTSTVFVNPASGIDTNPGTLALPRATIPTPATGLKVLVAAGTTLQGTGAAGDAVSSSVNNFCVSVYDSVTSSPTYGQEIFTQPNPFDRAMGGGTVTEQERAEMYFTIDRGSVPSDTVATKGYYFNPASSTYRNVIRGAIIKNATQFGVECRNGTLRVEDCIIENIQWVPTTANGYFGGVGLRVNVNTTAKIDAARLFMQDIGEDVAWLHNGTSGHKIVDSAIVHNCAQQRFGIQHGDFAQFDAYPGDFVLRRLAVRHRVQRTTLLNSGNGETTPIGAVIMSTGTLGTDTPGGLVEDVVFLTNRQGFNFEKQSGTTLRRVIGLVVGDDGLGTTDLLTYQHGAHIQQDCVFATQYTSADRVKLLSGATVSASGVQDLGRLDV